VQSPYYIDDAKRVARFDLLPGEVQALCALVKRSLFDCEQIDANEDLSHSGLPV
jgi:hypothetical protein